MSDTVSERLTSLIVDLTGREPKDVIPSAKLVDLVVDSLEVIVFLSGLENEFSARATIRSAEEKLVYGWGPRSPPFFYL